MALDVESLRSARVPSVYGDLINDIAVNGKLDLRSLAVDFGLELGDFSLRLGDMERGDSISVPSLSVSSPNMLSDSSLSENSAFLAHGESESTSVGSSSRNGRKSDPYASVCECCNVLRIKAFSAPCVPGTVKSEGYSEIQCSNKLQMLLKVFVVSSFFAKIVGKHQPHLRVTCQCGIAIRRLRGEFDHTFLHAQQDTSWRGKSTISEEEMTNEC